MGKGKVLTDNLFQSVDLRAIIDCIISCDRFFTSAQK